jgi:hypothetical protein
MNRAVRLFDCRECVPNPAENPLPPVLRTTAATIAAPPSGLHAETGNASSSDTDVALEAGACGAANDPTPGEV